MSKILDTLYLGSYADAKNLTFLQKNKISHIVTVGVELQTLYPENFKYLYIPAYDHPGYKLNEYFDQIADFIHSAIDKEKGKVFVHCYWGISRSTTSVLTYLVKYLKMTPAKARRFVKSKRSIIYPNEGFLQQIDAYALKLGVIEDKTLPKSYSSTLINPLSGANSPSNTKSGFLPGRSGSLNRREEKVVENDFHCKNCGLRVFHTRDVTHNAKKSLDSDCNAVYIKEMPWMKQKGSGVKIFCPNVKCNSILGYVNKINAKCSCGKSSESVFAVYPLRIVSSKAKGTNGLGKSLL